MIMGNDNNFLNVTIFNCRGIGSDKSKRNELFRIFRQRKYSLIILTETHVEQKLLNYIQVAWGYKIFGSCFSNNARGVIVLINNIFEFKFVEGSFNKDSEGRIVKFDFIFEERLFRVIGIYAPDYDCQSFFENLKDNYLNIEDDVHLIMGGDMNVVLDYEKDTKGLVNRNNLNDHKKLKEIIA